jgi:phosphatidylglycerol:prolipoprotein diacylglycerol transferase
MTIPNAFFMPIYQLGTFTFSGYFGFMGAGIVGALLFLLAANRKRDRITRAQLADSALMAIVGGILGGKIFHIIFENPGSYLDDPWRVLTDWRKGFVLYGSLVFGSGFTYYYCRWHNLSFGRVSDVFALALPLGVALGRLGCACAGCCYGSPTSLFWGVAFEPQHLGARTILPQVLAAHSDWTSIPLHPTQLLESIGCFIIFITLWLARHRTKPPGTRLIYMAFGYALFRFAIEFLRADRRSFIVESILSQAQGISLIIIFAFIVYTLRLQKKSSGGSILPPVKG